MRPDQEDIPKTVASVMVMIPGLSLRTGLIYLRTKRKLHQNAKIVMKSMIEGGVPEGMAKSLADMYEEDLSVRNIIRSTGILKG